MGRAHRWVAAFALFAGAVLASASPGFARQDDPRLAPLFAKLQATPNDDEGETLVEEIWSIWLRHVDEKIDRLMARGMLAMTRQDFDAALSIFDDMVALAPDFAEGWNKRATVHYLLGNHAASLADVERTLALEPRHFGALSGLGLIHLARGDDRAALAAFERGLKVNPHMRLIKVRVRELREKLHGRPT